MSDSEYRGTLMWSNVNEPNEAFVDLVRETLNQSDFIETEVVTSDEHLDADLVIHEVVDA